MPVLHIKQDRTRLVMPVSQSKKKSTLRLVMPVSQPKREGYSAQSGTYPGWYGGVYTQVAHTQGGMVGIYLPVLCLPATLVGICLPVLCLPIPPWVYHHPTEAVLSYTTGVC